MKISLSPEITREIKVHEVPEKDDYTDWLVETSAIQFPQSSAPALKVTAAMMSKGYCLEEVFYEYSSITVTVKNQLLNSPTWFPGHFTRL